MSNFIKDFYSGTYLENGPYLHTAVLEQLVYDMALNRYWIGFEERIDKHSFILSDGVNLYQVISIDENTVVVQIVERQSDNKYELVKNSLRIMNLQEYCEFIQKTEY